MHNHHPYRDRTLLGIHRQEVEELGVQLMRMLGLTAEAVLHGALQLIIKRGSCAVTKAMMHETVSLTGQCAFMRKWLGLFFDVDDPPERIGLPGFIILAVFLLVCAVVWFHHPAG